MSTDVLLRFEGSPVPRVVEPATGFQEVKA